MSTDAGAAGDPLVELRAEISALDRAILEAVNRRLAVVARLKAHKESVGLGFLDRAREKSLVRALEEANPGPLSAEGLRELYGLILDLTKRELASR